MIPMQYNLRWRIDMRLVALACGSILMLGAQSDRAGQARELVEALGSERIEDREEASRKLKELGRAAFPELERAAKRADREIAARAALLIRCITIKEQLPPDLMKAAPGLEDRLAAGEPHTWTEVFMAAVEPRVDKRVYPQLGKEAIEPLAAAALRGAQTRKEKEYIIERVGLWKFKSAASEILKFLDDPSQEIQMVALTACGRLDAREALPRMLELLRRPLQDKLRWAAWAGLEAMRPKEAIPDLLKLLADPDLSIRHEIGTLLVKIGASEAVPPLLKLFNHSDPLIREGACRVLIDMRAKEAQPDLLRLLRSENPIVRERAGYVLGRLEVREAIPDFSESIRDKVPEVRGRAAWGLGVLGAHDKASVILPLLDDDNPQVRMHAAIALAKLKAREASLGLRKRLVDPDPWVRGWSMTALAELDDREATADIARRLDDSNPWVRRHAVDALFCLGARAHAPSIARRYEDHDSQVRYSVARALENFAVKETATAVLSSLNDDDGIRMWAARALGRMRAENAADKLVPLLTDKEPSVRGAAAQALGEIGATDKAQDVGALLGDTEEVVTSEWVDLRDAVDSYIEGTWDAQEQEDVSTVGAVAAAALCQMGSSEGVPTVLQLSSGERHWHLLNSLNFLRKPDCCRRLREKPLSKGMSDSRRKLIQSLAEEADLTLEVSPSFKGPPPSPFASMRTLGEKGRALSLYEALEQALLWSGHTFILEADRIRIVLRAEALQFWTAWWKAEQERK
jgi:HEAT repeat protein